ncbi:ShlB/FhaC/HecB family hemolysin secretion/activation protein [Selenomonas sp. F0473]|uniref:ShlB/FhaC/HecB family hemolysin secretion/activation protein n=1 Tax=Selenomonas sp. F0473 TaxID=999423 RepID=UPI00056468C6|nr:ShlB/FhaC/HecB family hemolysin secretion/activation protein [Selenomonas sp. F0473]
MRKRKAAVRGGFAALLCAAIAGAGTNVCAAPSLARPGEDIADQAVRPEIGVEDRTPTYRQDDFEAHFTVENFVLEAPELNLDKEELSRILEEGMGSGKTIADLRRTVDALTTYCRTHGYPAAAAYLPPQESMDGVIVLRIIPGRYNDIRIENNSRLKTPVAQRIIAGLKRDDIITTAKLETALYSVSDATGARAVGVLSPGASFGTSNLTVRIEDSKESNTVFYVENYGSTSTGRYRYGLQETLYDPSGAGDKVSAGAIVSNGSLRNFYVNYETVVGHGGTTFGLGVSRMNYKVGGALAAIGAEGNSLTLTLFGQAPLYHMTNRSLTFRYGYNYRDLNDDITGFDLEGKKHTHSVYAGLVGMRRMRGLLLNYNMNLTLGHLSYDSTYTNILGMINRTNEGAYEKLEADMTAVQRLGNATDLMVKLSGQKAWQNLDSSEDFYLGGPNGVRAYAQGEASGDEGLLGTAELRWHTPLRGLTLSTFYDAGTVWLSRSHLAGTTNRMTLRGWGVGAAYSNPGDWFARLDYARRIGLDTLVSPKNAASGRVWFLMGKIW